MFSQQDENKKDPFLEIKKLFFEKKYDELEIFLQSLTDITLDEVALYFKNILDERKVNFVLHNSATQGQIAILKLLLLCDVNINQSRQGLTPLMRAVSANQLEVAEMLLKESRTNPDIKSNKNLTALGYATRKGNIDMVNLLLSHGADPGIGQPNALQINPKKFKEEIKILFEEYLDKESDSLDSPSFSYHYNRHIVIDFVENTLACQSLKYRWDRKHPNSPCQILDKKNFLNESSVELNDNDIIRISIVAHHSPGSETLLGLNGIRIDYQQLTEQLIKLIGNHKAVINLIACGTGKGRTTEENMSMASYASKLHQMLVSQANRDIPVVARTHKVLFVDSGEKYTKNLGLPWTSESEDDLTVFFKRQPGSKVIFMMDEEGRQIKIDGYSYSWKEKIKEALLFAHSHTTVTQKKELFEVWLQMFEKMKPKEIFDVLSLELSKAETIVKKHNDPYSLTRFFSNSPDYDKLESLIKQGRPLFASRHTAQHPIVTGRKITKK